MWLLVKDTVALIVSDLRRYEDTYKIRKDKSYSSTKVAIESLLFKSGFQAALLYRMAHGMHRAGFDKLAWATTRLNQFFTSAEIEYNAEIGHGLLIPHPSGIVVGRGSKVGNRVTIYQGVTLGTRNWRDIKYPTVHDGVVLFAGCKVLGDCVIGHDSVIGSGVIIANSVPPHSKVIGINNNKVTKIT